MTPEQALKIVRNMAAQYAEKVHGNMTINEAVSTYKTISEAIECLEIATKPEETTPPEAKND